MAVLFFSMDRDIKQVSRLIFKVLNISSPVEGDSVNVLNEVYTQAYIMGHKIRLEENSYEYEDRYNYMISVAKHFTAEIKSNNDIKEYLADVIAILLKINLDIEIARERDEGLIVI